MAVSVNQLYAYSKGFKSARVGLNKDTPKSHKRATENAFKIINLTNKNSLRLSEGRWLG